MIGNSSLNLHFSGHESELRTTYTGTCPVIPQFLKRHIKNNFSFECTPFLYLVTHCGLVKKLLLFLGKKDYKF